MYYGNDDTWSETYVSYYSYNEDTHIDVRMYEHGVSRTWHPIQPISAGENVFLLAGFRLHNYIV